MNREKLIKKYEDLMYKYGECDVWEEDILPNLESMSYKEIKQQYDADKEYYEARSHRVLN